MCVCVVCVCVLCVVCVCCVVLQRSIPGLFRLFFCLFLLCIPSCILAVFPDLLQIYMKKHSGSQQLHRWHRWSLPCIVDCLFVISVLWAKWSSSYPLFQMHVPTRPGPAQFKDVLWLNFTKWGAVQTSSIEYDSCFCWICCHCCCFWWCSTSCYCHSGKDCHKDLEWHQYWRTCEASGCYAYNLWMLMISPGVHAVFVNVKAKVPAQVRSSRLVCCWRRTGCTPGCSSSGKPMTDIPSDSMNQYESSFQLSVGLWSFKRKLLCIFLVNWSQDVSWRRKIPHRKESNAFQFILLSSHNSNSDHHTRVILQLDLRVKCASQINFPNLKLSSERRLISSHSVFSSFNSSLLYFAEKADGLSWPITEEDAYSTPCFQDFAAHPASRAHCSTKRRKFACWRHPLWGHCTLWILLQRTPKDGNILAAILTNRKMTRFFTWILFLQITTSRNWICSRIVSNVVRLSTYFKVQTFCSTCPRKAPDTWEQHGEDWRSQICDNRLGCHETLPHWPTNKTQVMLP